MKIPYNILGSISYISWNFMVISPVGTLDFDEMLKMFMSNA